MALTVRAPESIMDPVSEEPSEYQPMNPETLNGLEALSMVDSQADEMYRAHVSMCEENPTVLHLSYAQLDETMMRHCYNVVTTGMFLGQLQRKLKKTQNAMNALAKERYRACTDRILQKPTLPSGATDTKAKNPAGLQKYDAEYRSSEYTRDPAYIQLQKREELLIEQIETVKSIQQAQRDKASFILGMQKAINQANN